MKLKIKILDKDIPSPKFAHTGDAGLDLYSTLDYILEPFERKLVPTGIKIEIPEGYARWSLRLLADKMVELNFVDSISHETIRKVLKKTNLSLGKSKNGVFLQP